MKLRTIMSVVMLLGVSQVAYGVRFRIVPKQSVAQLKILQQAARNVVRSRTANLTLASVQKNIAEYTPVAIITGLIAAVTYEKVKADSEAEVVLAPLPTQEEVNARCVFYKTVSER